MLMSSFANCHIWLAADVHVTGNGATDTNVYLTTMSVLCVPQQCVTDISAILVQVLMHHQPPQRCILSKRFSLRIPLL